MDLKLLHKPYAVGKLVVVGVFQVNWVGFCIDKGQVFAKVGVESLFIFFAYTGSDSGIYKLGDGPSQGVKLKIDPRQDLKVRPLGFGKWPIILHISQVLDKEVDVLNDLVGIHFFAVDGLEEGLFAVSQGFLIGPDNKFLLVGRKD